MGWATCKLLGRGRNNAAPTLASGLDEVDAGGRAREGETGPCLAGERCPRTLVVSSPMGWPHARDREEAGGAAPTLAVSAWSLRAFFQSESACVSVMILAKVADLIAVTCCMTALASAACAAACMVARPWMALRAEEACWAAARDWFCGAGGSYRGRVREVTAGWVWEVTGACCEWLHRPVSQW